MDGGVVVGPGVRGRRQHQRRAARRHRQRARVPLGDLGRGGAGRRALLQRRQAPRQLHRPIGAACATGRRARSASSAPSRGADGPAFMNFTSIDDRQSRNARPTSSSGSAITSSRSPSSSNSDVGMEARDLPARPVRARRAGAACARARPTPRRCAAASRDQALAPRLAQQRGAHPRDRDAERARVDAERAPSQPHRLHQHGAAAAERIDHGVARRA